jgi:hypothetical protein
MAGPPRHPLTTWGYLIHTTNYLATTDDHEIEGNFRSLKFEPSAIMRVIQLPSFPLTISVDSLHSLLAVTTDLHLTHAPDTVSK